MCVCVLYVFVFSLPNQRAVTLCHAPLLVPQSSHCCPHRGNCKEENQNEISLTCLNLKVVAFDLKLLYVLKFEDEKESELNSSSLGEGFQYWCQY